jgi:hypothetical protein
MNRPTFRMATVVFALIASVTLPLAAGEGFGMMKKTANLTRVHPPQVFIPGTRIVIRVTSPGGRYAAAAERLQSQLESELLGKNPRLKLDPSHPDATIDVAVLQSEYNDKWESRQMVRSVNTGQVDSKKRPIYRQEEVTVRFKVVSYAFGGTFKVHDTRKDRSLAADSINWAYGKDFQDGNGSPEPSSLESTAVQSAVNDLARRLAPTRELVGVLLPRGSLENAAAFADAGLWNKYLDALEKLPPLKTPTDEGYRQYALGVAYEALGYGADDENTTLKYLEQASAHYNNAVDANPKEGYFTKAYQSILFSSRSAEAPLTRVQSALVQYQKLKEFSDSLAAAPVALASKSGSKGDLGAPRADDSLTNEGVIDMLRAGLSEDIILTSIDSLPHTAFDVSPRGLIQLSEAKATKRLIQRIQTASNKASSAPKPKKSTGKKS